MRPYRYGGVAAVGYLALLCWTLAAQPLVAASHYQVRLPLIITSISAQAGSPTEQQVIDLINQRRQEHGCPAVSPSMELSNAARKHNADMTANSFFSHTGSDGSTFVDRAQAAGYPYQPSGEILAAGYPTPSAVVEGWMQSDGHRKIILTCANDDIGVALEIDAQSQYHTYWTAVFGQR